MRHGIGWAVIAVLFSLVSGFAVADDAAEKWGKVTDGEWQLAAPDSFPEAAAVVIFDIGSLEVPPPYEGSFIEFKRHVRIKILKKAGAEDAAKIEIDEGSLRGFKAQTILASGEKIEVKGKDVFKKKVGDNSEVTTFTFPALEDGCIIEYQYGYLQDNYSFLKPWEFQGDLFTLKSQFSLKLWQGLDYNALMVNVPPESRTPASSQETVDKSGPVTYTWVLHNLYPIEDEPFMAAESNYRAAIICQLRSYKDRINTLYFVDDWKSLGEKVLDYYKDFVGGKGSLEKTAKSLTVLEFTEQNKIRRIFRFVRDEILTQGDQATLFHDLSNVGKVLEQKSGNGFEKNALLIEMLKASGFDASPLIIGTRDHSTFNPEVYQLSQFNHLICHVQLGNEQLLLDASERGVPFGYLPPNDLVSGGLLLRKEGSGPISLNIAGRKSSFETTSRMKVHADGSVICSTHVLICGYQIHAKRDLLQDRPPDDRLRDLLLHEASAQFELSSYTYSKEIDGDSAGIDLVLTFPALCEVADKQLVCTPQLFTLKENPFTKPRRYFPVDFNYPVSYVDVVDLECDEGLSLAAVPQDAREQIEGINFTRSILTAGRSARIMTQLIISRPLFLPGAYSRLRGVFGKVTDVAVEPVTLTF
jgi:hypothetical protein